MGEAEDLGITLSIFERLTDRSPSTTREPTHGQQASTGEIEASVIQHLEILLNVRLDRLPDDAYPETCASAAAYGISDFSSLSLTNPTDRERLRRSMERAIRLFEPRLSRVQVLLDDWQPEHLGLRFRIEAVLRLGLAAEPIAFSALLAKDNRRLEVIEAAR